MAEYSIFDIVGPIMIGPSSSHTAGAVRLGYLSRKIVGEEVKKVTFCLHGSFAKTYKGHGTDKALLAGIMGFLPHDERIRDSFEIAQKKKIQFEFIEKDLGEVHPNTAKIELTTVNDESWEITGSSIGGGKVKIIRINTMDVEFEGEYTTLITYHYDRPGVVASITGILAKYEVNIAFMKLFREDKGTNAILILETDEGICGEAVKEIGQNKYISMAKIIEPIP